MNTVPNNPFEVDVPSNNVNYNNSVTAQNTAFNGPNNIVPSENLESMSQIANEPIVNNQPQLNNNQNGNFPPSFVNNNQPQENNSVPENSRKNQFVNMGWLYNQKLTNNQQLVQNEVTLLTLSYNLNFGNLRISFGNFDTSTLSKNYIKLPNIDQMSLCTCSIFPEMASEILYQRQNKVIQTPLRIYERVFSRDNSWLPTPLYMLWNQENIFLNAQNSQHQYLFTISGSQISLFERALWFMIDGNAWKLSAEYNIHVK
jgi:hypothetical protein